MRSVSDLIPSSFHHFKMTKHIGEKISKIYERLIGESGSKIKAMEEAVDVWEGICE